MSLLVTGAPDEVKGYRGTFIETAGNDGVYIMAPWATSDVKVENPKAMPQALKEHVVYRK
jgi:hypothetical protein